MEALVHITINHHEEMDMFRKHFFRSRKMYVLNMEFYMYLLFMYRLDLVTSFSQVGIAHQKVFSVAATPLRHGLGKVRQGSELLDIAQAYSKFGFRHDKLFMEITRIAPATTLEIEELRNLLGCFTRVHFKSQDVDFLQELLEYRTS